MRWKYAVTLHQSLLTLFHIFMIAFSFEIHSLKMLFSDILIIQWYKKYYLIFKNYSMTLKVKLLNIFKQFYFVLIIRRCLVFLFIQVIHKITYYVMNTNTYWFRFLISSSKGATDIKKPSPFERFDKQNITRKNWIQWKYYSALAIDFVFIINESERFRGGEC